MSNILTPLMPPYTPELAMVMERYPQQDGYLLKLFRVFANSARFAKKAVPNLLDKGSPLSLREREIIILRTTANNDASMNGASMLPYSLRLLDLQKSRLLQQKMPNVMIHCGMERKKPCWHQ